MDGELINSISTRFYGINKPFNPSGKIETRMNLMKEISVIGATSSLGINLVSFLAENGYTIYASYRSESRVPAAWRKNPSIILQKVSEQNDRRAE